MFILCIIITCTIRGLIKVSIHETIWKCKSFQVSHTTKKMLNVHTEKWKIVIEFLGKLFRINT